MSETRRHLALAWYGARNVVRRWRRSVAVMVPLALAIALATTATLVADGIRRDAARAASFAADLTVQKMEHGRLVPVEVAPIAAALQQGGQVERIRPRVFALVPAPYEDSESGALATLLGIDWGAAAPPPYDLIEGRLPNPHETGVVVLGRGVAGSLEVGAIWQLPTSDGPHPLRVIGLLSDRVAVHGANLALTSADDVRAVLGMPASHASEIAIDLEPDAHVTAVADQMVARFGLRVVGRAALGRILDAIYGSRSGAFVTIWLVLLLVAPAVAWALGMDVAAAERHEMGVLKALGWSTLQLVEARMIEGAIMGLGASLAGALGGALYALAGAPGVADLFSGWAALYPGFRPPLAVEAGSMVALLAIGVVPLLAAMAVPAWRTGATPPETVMRD